jgi:hypothetical protein
MIKVEIADSDMMNFYFTSQITSFVINRLENAGIPLTEATKEHLELKPKTGILNIFEDHPRGVTVYTWKPTVFQKDFLDLINVPNPFEEARKLAKELEQYGGRFLPCGSRWFAERYPSAIQIDDSVTDFDFYCMDTESNRKILDDLGFYFTQNVPVYPLDDLAVAIYCKDKIQVIVRSDTAKYANTILNIQPEFYRDFLWKSGPNKPERMQIQRIFNQLFKMAV